MKAAYQRGKYVSRSTYQKVCEENKKLKADIKLLVLGGIGVKKMKLLLEYREQYKKEKTFNYLLKQAAKEWIKENPQYNINPNAEGQGA